MKPARILQNVPVTLLFVSDTLHLRMYAHTFMNLCSDKRRRNMDGQAITHSMAQSVARFADTTLVMIAVALSVAISHQVHGATQDGNTAEFALETAIASTLEHHPALAGQHARIEAKGYAMAEARSLRLPTLGGSVGHGFDNDDSAEATLQLRQPVWTFGRIDRELGYARIDRDTERAEAQALRRDLSERTALAYAQVLGAIRQLNASRQDVDILSDLVDQVRRRAKASLASAADVALAEARQVQMIATREGLRADVALARVELLALTQLTIATDMTIPDSFLADTPLDELQETALRNNPDLLRGERRVALARANAARERTRAYPTIYLEGSRTFSEIKQARDTEFGIVVEGGLDGLGIVRANRVRALDASGRAAQAELAQTRTELRTRISSLHTMRAAALALANSYRESITQLDNTLASYRRQYEAGRKEWLELLNLYREVAELRLQYEQSYTDYISNSFVLIVATGQLDYLALANPIP